MATVIDYALNTDRALSENKLNNLRAQMMPLEEAISLRNAMTRQGQLQQSKHRFNRDIYNISKLPAAAKSQVLSGKDGAYAAANNIVYGNVDKGSLTPEQQRQLELKTHALASAIQKGARNDYVKSTHTNTDLNQVYAGRNAEITLNQIMSILNSVAKFAGYSGKGRENIEKFRSGLGMGRGITNADYANFNVFKNTLANQLGDQLTQFYGGSVQPEQVADRVKMFSPQPWESPAQYIARVHSLSNNLRNELNARKGTFNDMMTKPTPDLQVTLNPNPYLGRPTTQILQDEDDTLGLR